ncbi:MAG: pyruvoyl-dependent arginine decarboxylase [Actinomycetota bacterium]|nr:pyruvoyl-dependent arginine decarboxylase [Actinomycetota bacterium]
MTELASIDSDSAILAGLKAPTRVIPVVGGTGYGPTPLAAFDAALRQTGVANYNLVRLSSVIPAGSAVVDGGAGPTHPDGEWGDRLYVVMAEQRAHRIGEEAWAGVGWVQERASGRGLFVEHEGTDESQVRADIDASLGALCAGRPEPFGPIHSSVHGTRCQGQVACAVVVAVYEASSWSTREPLVLP